MFVMEVTASDFARMCGLSPMAVSKRIANGTLIRNAARRIDTDNPVNRAFLETKQNKLKMKLQMKQLEAGIKQATSPSKNSGKFDELCNTIFSDAANGRKKQAPNDSGSQTVAGMQKAPGAVAQGITVSSGSAKDIMNCTMGELLRRFNSIDNIERFSKIIRDLSAAEEREQKLQERRLVQVPKDFVVQRVFGYMDQLMEQLLDVPEAVCDQVIAVSLANGQDKRESVMNILNDNLTRCISGAKSHIVNELTALRSKYDKQENENIRLREELAEMDVI